MSSLLQSSTTLDASRRVALPALNGAVEVPILACGTWAWGDATWTYDEARDLPNIQQAWSTLNRAQIGFYDTAEVYGKGESERIIGRLLKDTPQEERERVLLATKWLPVPILFNRWMPRGVRGCLELSLRRLGVEQVGLYQVHSAFTGIYSVETVAKGLAECVKAGLTKAVGVSNYGKEQMERMHAALKAYGVPLASNQIEFSLVRRLPEESGLLAACRALDVVPLAYSPLAQGRLTGKYSSTKPVPSGRRFSDIPIEQLEGLLDVMRAIAAEHGVTCSAVALNYVMCKGCIPLSGAKNAEQAEQNAMALGWRLSEAELARLEEHTRSGKLSAWQRG